MSPIAAYFYVSYKLNTHYKKDTHQLLSVKPDMDHLFDPHYIKSCVGNSDHCLLTVCKQIKRGNKQTRI